MDLETKAYVAYSSFSQTDADALVLLLPKESREEVLRLPERMRAGAACARLLLNYLLKEKAHLPKEELVFSRDEFSKPYFSTHPEIFFNLSHTKTYAAAAVSAQKIGVDIENFRPLSRRLKERFFSKDELCYIEGAQDEEERAVEIWTRKEAYSKMDGRGLLLPFSSFSSLILKEQIRSMRLRDCALSVSTFRPSHIFWEEMSIEKLFGYFSGEIVAKKD